jgi:urease subunit gamma/beta
MRLTPTERDRLLIFTAAELARARRARGLRLNIPEATALIADTVCEAARDGRRLAEAVEAGRSVLGAADVLPGVADAIGEIQVEAVFDDGTRLAVVNDPFRGAVPLGPAAPGAAIPRDEPVGRADPDAGRDEPITVQVVNTGEVPVSVTSHFHFFEVNRRLAFERAHAYGMSARIPAGSTVRFEPGRAVPVPLAPIGGHRIAIGFSGLVDGPLDAPGAREAALERAAAEGYLMHAVAEDVRSGQPGGTR